MIVPLSIPEGPSFFTGLLTIPTTEYSDKRGWKLKGKLAPLRNVDSITISLNDVILASMRYLYVTGRDDAEAIKLVNGWIDTLRWHMAAFWNISHNKNCVFPKADAVKATSVGDHAKFSGEMIAQGVAIKVLGLLGYGEQNLYFYPSGNRASPDFVVLDPSENAATAIIDRDGTRIALEARCRKHAFRFKRGERATLNRKKKGFAAVLAVYFVHAKPYKRPDKVNGPQRTRILLIDPEGEPAKSRGVEPYEVAIRHYQGVARRIGLWRELDILEQMMARLKNIDARALLDAQTGVGMRGQRHGEYHALPGILPRVIGGHRFFGRDFNELLADKDVRSTEELRRRIKAQDFGRIRFYGLLESVLLAIQAEDYGELLGPHIADLQVRDASVGVDGSVFIDRDPDERELEHFRAQFTNEINSVRRKYRGRPGV